MTGIFGGIIAQDPSGTLPETHTLVTGNSGTSGVRLRGYSVGLIGTLTPTATTIGGATQITDLYYDESVPQYLLQVNGGTNSGWTQMVVDSTTFARTSATYSSGFWTWSTTNTIANQVFGANGTSHTVTFS